MTLGLSPVPAQRQGTVVIPQDVPVYRVKTATYLDDHLYTESNIISWTDEPNIEMEPLNALAREAMDNFVTKLDILGMKVAKKTGKSYTSYKDAFENAYALAQEDGRRVHVLNGKKTVPLMGAKKARRAHNLAEENAPLMSGSGGKQIVGRNAVNARGDDGQKEKMD